MGQRACRSASHNIPPYFRAQMMGLQCCRQKDGASGELQGPLHVNGLSDGCKPWCKVHSIFIATSRAWPSWSQTLIDCVFETGMTFMPENEAHSSCWIQENTAATWRGPMVMSALESFITTVDWGKLDALVIDMPPGTGSKLLLQAKIFGTPGVTF